MGKVIYLKKREYNVEKKYNNLYDINDAVARAKGMVGFRNQTKRKMYREHVIAQANIADPKPLFPVTHRDIKRIERPSKCEIPVNIVDILEVVVNDVHDNRDNIKYRANDNDKTVSEYMLETIVYMIRLFYAWLQNNPVGKRPENDKYRKEADHIMTRLQQFDQNHPGMFDSLFAE